MTNNQTLLDQTEAVGKLTMQLTTYARSLNTDPLLIAAALKSSATVFENTAVAASMAITVYNALNGGNQ